MKSKEQTYEITLSEEEVNIILYCLLEAEECMIELDRHHGDDFKNLTKAISKTSRSFSYSKSFDDIEW